MRTARTIYAIRLMIYRHLPGSQKPDDFEPDTQGAINGTWKITTL